MKGQEEAGGKHSWKKNKLVQRLGGILGGETISTEARVFEDKEKAERDEVDKIKGF